MPENHRAKNWPAPKYPYPDADDIDKAIFDFAHKAWRKAFNTCDTCGSSKIEVRNYSAMWHDGDIYCENDHYVRMYDAG